MIKDIKENVSVNQVDDDLHIEIPLKDLKNFNGNVMVDLPGSKKHFNSNNYRHYPSDFDIVSEIEDNEDDDMYNVCDDCNTQKASEVEQTVVTETSCNVDTLIKAYLTAELTLCDVEHIRLHSVGENFDNIVQYTFDYRYRLFDNIDVLGKLALETHDSLPNKALATTIIKDYALQNDASYNYEKANNRLKQIICNYVVVLRDLYDTLDTTDKKNTINTIIRDWSQQVNYYISRKTVVQ